jgi:hypothetical protein
VTKANAHRVFISYCTADKHTADVICAALEHENIRCWIAPRDIPPGAPWPPAISAAIDAAEAVVLILSAAANVSSWVADEALRAASKGVPIILFRVEEVEPAASIELFLRRVQWLDAFVLPFEHHLQDLIAGVQAIVGRDHSTTDGPDVAPYMVSRGPAAHRAFTARPGEPWDSSTRGVVTIQSLRSRLVRHRMKLAEPVEITVRGTLFPCALLSSGWWESGKGKEARKFDWKDTLQQWLFHGFDQWGPSWDFTWNFENWSRSRKRPYFIAQLGDGDEANSIPVLLPADKAKKLSEHFQEKNAKGGIEAEVSGLLGHRRHFGKHVDPRALELFGGLLDYCLWLGVDKKKYKVSPLSERTQIYSGYLWKCVAPKKWMSNGAPVLDDVYFIWEHVNFAAPDSIAFSLEAMDNKEQQIRRKRGPLSLVQKSSHLVPGEPALAADRVYSMLLAKKGEDI